jgi:hypothetical protein
LDKVLNWLHDGYPSGVPKKDYFPLLALLTRTLSEEEVMLAAQTLLLEGDPETPVTPEQIEQAIKQVAEKAPTVEEMNQVAARLASVGWPLATPVN